MKKTWKYWLCAWAFGSIILCAPATVLAAMLYLGICGVTGVLFYREIRGLNDGHKMGTN